MICNCRFIYSKGTQFDCRNWVMDESKMTVNGACPEAWRDIPGTCRFLIRWFFWQWCFSAVTVSAPAVRLNCSWWWLVFTMMLFIWVPPVNSLPCMSGSGRTESLWGAGRNLWCSMRPLTLPFLHVISGLAVCVEMGACVIRLCFSLQLLPVAKVWIARKSGQKEIWLDRDELNYSTGF